MEPTPLPEKIGEGRSGEFWGNGELGFKLMFLEGEEKVHLANNEIAMMFQYQDDYDVGGMLPNGCYAKKENGII